MKSPAFQWYPGDYLASQRVQLMSLEEEGAYIRLLCFCWVHGSIPSDPDRCARLIGKGGSTTLATTVLSMFQPDPLDSSKMIHDRLENERRKQSDWREKSSAGGKKSAAMREASRVVQPNGNTSVSPLLSPVSRELSPKARGSLEELRAFCLTLSLQESDGDWLFDKWNGNEWTNDGKKIKDWKATVRAWKAINIIASQKSQSGRNGNGHRSKSNPNDPNHKPF